MSELALNKPISLFDPKESIQRFFKNQPGFVYKIINGFRFSNQQKDDIFQDVFLLAWKNSSSLKSEKKMNHWIATITKNRCVDTYRKTKSMVLTDDVFQLGELMADKETLHATTVEEIKYAIDFEIAIDQLGTIIDKLKNPDRRKIARMYYIDHVSVKDIASQLDLNINTVLTHMSRFRIILKKAWIAFANEKNLELG
ncbi:MAG: sigma-70 family RNA polymerase sigma factor [Pseudobacteriovorax sp.]|nr:sigma-70 family RNA polymerase sigma factor [Pseudobacteriovorax sp.]